MQGRRPSKQLLTFLKDYLQKHLLSLIQFLVRSVYWPPYIPALTIVGLLAASNFEGNCFHVRAPGEADCCILSVKLYPLTDAVPAVFAVLFFLSTFY